MKKFMIMNQGIKTIIYPVRDIAAGAKVAQEVKDVGGSKLIASVKDSDRNIIGLIQLP